MICGLTALAAAIRLHGLGAQSLWLDEWYSVSDAARSVTDIVWLADGEPPLHKLLLHGLLVLGFGSDIAARLPSAVAGTLAVPLAWLVARRLTDPTVALVTAGLLALNPFAVWYAHEARVYSLLLLCALGASAAWLRAPERSGARFAYVAWMSAGIGCHYFFGFVAIAHAIAAAIDGWREPSRRRAWATLLLAAGIGMAVWLPPLAADFAEQTATDRGAHFSWWAAPYTGFAFVGGFSLGPPLRVLHEIVARGEDAGVAVEPHGTIVAAALFASALLGAMALGATPLRRRPLLAIMTIVPVVLPMIAGMLATGYRPRYAIAALPFWLCWQASALRGRLPRFAAALLMLLATLEIAGLAQLESPAYVREDARAAAAYLRERSPHGPVLLIGEPATAFRRYADPGWLVLDLNARGDGEPETTLAAARRALATTTELVIVASRPWTIDADGALRASFTRGATLLGSTVFPGVTVERYAFQRSAP